MTVLEERNLMIKFPAGVIARKFDGAGHGLSHCMKAVDFIAELTDRILFIEFKDPDNPEARDSEREEFLKNFVASKLDNEFKEKFRDSFLYHWASDQIGKPIYYYVLIAAEKLTAAELLNRTDALKRNLPAGLPEGRKRALVHGCAVFNIATWNQCLPEYPVSRIKPSPRIKRSSNAPG